MRPRFRCTKTRLYVIGPLTPAHARVKHHKTQPCPITLFQLSDHALDNYCFSHTIIPLEHASRSWTTSRMPKCMIRSCQLGLPSRPAPQAHTPTSRRTTTAASTTAMYSTSISIIQCTCCGYWLELCSGLAVLDDPSLLQTFKDKGVDVAETDEQGLNCLFVFMSRVLDRKQLI